MNMKRNMSVNAVLLVLCCLLTGCGSVRKEDKNTQSFPVKNEALNVGTEQEQDIKNEENKTIEDRTVEYNHDNLYMSLKLPEGWDYKIKTAEDMAKEDGLVTCAIEFWSKEYPESIFELGYVEPFAGICATGVTMEDFTLNNGISGTRCTEEIEGTLWMILIFDNESDNPKEGTYQIIASPELEVWEKLNEEFDEILETVWVGVKNSDFSDDKLGTEFSGYYLKSSDGADMIVDKKGSPIVIDNLTGDDKLFDGLSNGDEIKVKSTCIEETYPGKAGVYSCEKIADGDIENIPEETVKELTKLGWLQHEQ